MNIVIESVSILIRLLAKKGIAIPTENNKNDYTRACWALSQLQKLRHSNRYYEKLAPTVESIRASLPELRRTISTSSA